MHKPQRIPRVALMVPSSNTVMETDLHRELAGRCTVHVARMFLVDTTREAEIRMIEQYAPRAAEDLGTLNPDLLIFGCTSAGALFGQKYDAELCEKYGQLARAPALGVLSAVTDQLEGLEIKRLAILAPYVDELTRTVARSVTSSTRRVVAVAAMGISDNVKLSAPTPEQIVHFAQQRLGSESEPFDALLVPCTNFRALEAKALLESAFRVPVITSNSAVIDAVRRRFGLIS